ncbi:MAG: DUF975 family protein [Alistipes sp.]|nr:DUF975 family protein [Alistipes sp.]
MKTNSEIRQESLALLKGNWGAGVGATLLYCIVCFVAIFVTMAIASIVAYGAQSPETTSLITQLASLLVSIFFIYPIAMGMMTMFLPFVRGEKPLQASGLFYTLKAPYYKKSIGVYLLIYIFTLLWTLLLIIPGIIKALSYSLAPYIMAENPELTANQAIEKSMKMMKGHKMDLFLIYLGYLGFSLLSIVGLCIPLLWIMPYYLTVFAKFYEEVKSEYNATATE